MHIGIILFITWAQLQNFDLQENNSFYIWSFFHCCSETLKNYRNKCTTEIQLIKLHSVGGSFANCNLKQRSNLKRLLAQTCRIISVVYLQEVQEGICPRGVTFEPGISQTMLILIMAPSFIIVLKQSEVTVILFLVVRMKCL